VESYTINPFAGFIIAVRLVVEVLGISRPLLLALISSIELAFGVVVPMPTFWAKEDAKNKIAIVESKNNFFIDVGI